MAYPEFARIFVGARKREPVRRERVGEERRGEGHSHFAGFAPVGPPLEVLEGNFVPVDLFAAELPVNGVEVQARLAGYVLHSLGDVVPQLPDIARLAREVARSLDSPAAERRVGGFKSADVVALPAVHGKRDFVEDLHSLFGVHPEIGVNPFCRIVSRCHMKAYLFYFVLFSSFF